MVNRNSGHPPDTATMLDEHKSRINTHHSSRTFAGNNTLFRWFMIMIDPITLQLTPITI